MDSPGLSFLLRSIGFQTPQILVYVIGVILALVFVRRCPAAAILTLAATAILTVTALGHAAALGFLIHQRAGDGNWNVEMHQQLMLIANILSSLARALGLALLLSAVFVGRKPRLGGRVQPVGEFVHPQIAPDVRRGHE